MKYAVIMRQDGETTIKGLYSNFSKASKYMKFLAENIISWDETNLKNYSDITDSNANIQSEDGGPGTYEYALLTVVELDYEINQPCEILIF